MEFITPQSVASLRIINQRPDPACARQIGCICGHISQLLIKIFILIGFGITSAEAISISGKIKLPDGLTTSEDTVFQIYVFNELPGVSQGSKFSSIVVPAGATEFDYEFQDLIENEGENYIRYVCACNQTFIKKGFFGSAGVVFAKEDARRFSANVDHVNIELNLELGTQVNFTIRLPEEVATPTENSIRLILYVNEGGFF